MILDLDPQLTISVFVLFYHHLPLRALPVRPMFLQQVVGLLGLLLINRFPMTGLLSSRIGSELWKGSRVVTGLRIETGLAGSLE